MANLFDWNATESKIASMLSDFPELEIRSKALTALGTLLVLDISDEEALDAITDGRNDRGVDALFVDDRQSRHDVHLFQVKCVSNFQKSKNNFPSSEIDKLTSFVSDLTNEDMESLDTANLILKGKIYDALDALKSSNSRIFVHFVGNMEGLVPDELQRIKSVFERYNAVNFLMHNLDDLSDFFLKRTVPALSRELTIVDSNFFERVDRNVRGLVCTVLAADIVDFIRSSDDPDAVEIGIFDQNVRVFLRNQNRINQRIQISALADDNHMFWYKNNGITMTCDKIEMGSQRRAPTIRLENVQIVNGGQTSNCLFEASKLDMERLTSAMILVRVIETSSEEVKISLSESTNSQTPINSRDIRSNDRILRQLEEGFADIGWFFERKSKQHQDQSKRNRIDALSAGQSYLAYEIGLPEVAKKDRGRIFGDLYDTVFSEEVTVERLLVSHQLAASIANLKTAVRKKIKEEQDLMDSEAALIDGASHVLFAVRQILQRDDEDMWNLEVAQAKIEVGLYAVGITFARARMSEKNFSSNRFFKDPKTKDLITRTIGNPRVSAPVTPPSLPPQNPL